MYACNCYFLLDVRANQFGLAWVPWRIDSFDKYNTVVYFMHNIISCTHIYNFLWDVRANQFGHAWVPWSIDSFDKYSTFAYFTCIISSHVCMYLLFSFGCSGEPVRPVPWSMIPLINTVPFVLYMHNIISCCTSAIFFWMFGRTSSAMREFPEV